MAGAASPAPGGVPGSLHWPGAERVQLRESTLSVRYRPGRRPLVVFEAGLGLPGSLWRAVWERLPGDQALLCYDRAGLGGSDVGPSPRCGLQQLTELRELLDRLKLVPPYVLVGHSAGAFVVRLFATCNPNEIAGLVLVDPSQEDGRVTPPALDALANGALRVLSVLAVGGARDALLAVANRAAALCPAARAARHVPLLAALSTRAHLTGLVRENEGYRSTVAQMRAAIGVSSLPDVPLRVITAGHGSSGHRLRQARWKRSRQLALDAALAAASSRGEHLLAPGSGHLIPLDAPHVVAQAVIEIS